MESRSQPLQSPLTAQVWGMTDKGRRREGNEDAVYPETGAEFFHPAGDKLAAKGQLLVVADGMGGAQAGGEASRWAIRVAVERYYDTPGDSLGVNLKSAIETANNSLYQYLRSTNVEEAGCTMTAAVIHNGLLHVVNVGDSRVYLLRSGQITQLTRDHTVTQAKVDQGLLAPEKAKLDPERNVVTRSLGTRPEVRADLFPPLPLAAGDSVLLCSDGLTDMLTDAEILRLTTGVTPDRAARRLIAAANKRGGIDNISVVLARIGEKSTLHAEAGRQKLPGKQLAVLAALFILLLLVLVIWGWSMRGSRPTPLPTPTPTLLPASTLSAPTLGATATLPATVAETPPTSTPIPAGAATSTAMPTLTPTLALAPRTPAPGETPGTSALQLLAPDRGLGFKNPLRFAWAGQLQAGQQFQLIIRHEATGYEAVYPLGEQTGWEVDLPAAKAGQWLWRVRIVKGEQVIAESELWHFYFVPVEVSTSEPAPTPGVSTTEPTPTPGAPDRPGSP